MSTSAERVDRRGSARSGATALAALVALLFVVSPPLPGQQTFNSGSNGSDGALNLTTPGTILFDPSTFSPPLDADGDGVYHFTTINIANGTTVMLRASNLGLRPLVWLAQADVEIAGTLTLDGEQGRNPGTAVAAVPGVGGFYGGFGSTPTGGATPGQGPGGGRVATGGSNQGGGGAGHLVAGGGGASPGFAPGGVSYSSVFLQPLVGGSGGGGGGIATPNGFANGGGGAGGGAILIASSTRINLTGVVSARGGSGGGTVGGQYGGGGGSGGAIRLMATTIQGTGQLIVTGGGPGSAGGPGSQGRVRLEAINQQFTGSADPSTYYSRPGSIFPPTSAPRVRVSAVDGVSVPASPTGGFPPADVIISAAGTVTFSIEASNIPVGTVVRLSMFSDSRQTLTIDSTPLAGTLASSTATATATIPSGFSRFTVQATWTP